MREYDEERQGVRVIQSSTRYADWSLYHLRNTRNRDVTLDDFQEICAAQRNLKQRAVEKKKESDQGIERTYMHAIMYVISCSIAVMHHNQVMDFQCYVKIFKNKKKKTK